ncbi:hypothetical protein DVH24_037815 [Malus domestica]|uniref:Uncharacterized protein n=1 Tax=Malus domestica TaxID=3750 RepID=A0A498JYW0_MALDO|nr:hypothetical protein DVH24_037815 [Malus domestica]
MRYVIIGEIPGMEFHSSHKQNRKGVVGAQSGQYRATVESSSGCGEYNPISPRGVDSVNLMCIFQSLPRTMPFGSSLASVSSHESNPNPPGSSSVSSQKQNREGVVGAENGQYRAMAESSLGCGEGPGRDVTSKVSIPPPPGNFSCIKQKIRKSHNIPETDT